MAPGALLARFVRSAHLALPLGSALAALGCEGEVLNLGASPLEAGGAGAGATAGATSRIWDLDPTPLLPQADRVLLANPTLNAEATELYYSTQVRGSDARVRIEMAKRVASGFGNPVELHLGDADPFGPSSPAVSADGEELWFGLLDATSGHTEIWHSAREGGVWGDPTPVPELSSPDGDTAARPPALEGTLMPLSSKRHGKGPYYQIYFSERAGVGSAWGEPHQTGLTEINSPDFQSADGFLSDAGLELYFSSTRDADHTDHDLYVARRSAIDADFGAPEPLMDVNDPASGKPSEERMPWLSPDGQQLYFVSDRSGQYTLYQATKR